MRQDEFVKVNSAECVNTEPKPETAKSILEHMDVLLNELKNQLSYIESAIYSPKPKNEDGREPMDECMLGTLNRQRNKAEEILKTAIHIREGLW